MQILYQTCAQWITLKLSPIFIRDIVGAEQKKVKLFIHCTADATQVTVTHMNGV